MSSEFYSIFAQCTRAREKNMQQRKIQISLLLILTFLIKPRQTTCTCIYNKRLLHSKGSNQLKCF